MPHTSPVFVTLDRRSSGPLMRSLRRFSLLAPQAHSWGSSAAYEELFSRQAPLALLDVPAPGWSDALPALVRVLARTSPVTVLAPPGTEAPALLAAGALNVVSRDLEPRELVARITADMRWVLMRACRAPDLPGPRPRQRSQRVLLSVLTTAAEPWCCHDLMRLLGAAGRPLERAALRGRLQRLAPYVAALGLRLEASPGRGRTAWKAVGAVHGQRHCRRPGPCGPSSRNRPWPPGPGRR